MINPSTEKLNPEDYVGKAKPEKLPKPSYWPFFLAMGLTFMLWGILTGWIIGISGGLLFFISLSGWIKDLNDEDKEENKR